MSELARDPNQLVPEAEETSGQQPGDIHAQHAPGAPEPGVHDILTQAAEQFASAPEQAPGVPEQTPGIPDQAPAIPEPAPGIPEQAPGVPQQPPGIPEQAPGVPGQIAGEGGHIQGGTPPPPAESAHMLDPLDQTQGGFEGAATASAPMAAPVPPAPAMAAPVAESQPLAASDVRARPLPRINIQAFCEDQNTINILQQASQDRRLSKTHFNVQTGGLDAAVHYYRDAPTPNLIIVESMHKRDDMLIDMDRLAGVCDAGTKVIVIGHVNDVLLYRELLNRGVAEYLVMPLTVSQVMESLSNLYNDPSTDPLGRVIAFVGSKGGVGSSTICHNTAWAISQEVKSDVVIADMDLPFGTAGLDFNQDPVQGIADALLSPERLDEVLLDRLLSRCSDYLSLFAAPGTLDRPYDLGSDACDTVLDVLRTNIPYIAVDVPHMWTDWSQRVLIQADRVIITALPDLANLRNTKNLIDKLKAARPNDLPPLLVLNQVNTPKRPEISIKDFSSALECEPFAVIDFDPQLFGTATNNGQMIEELSPKAKVAGQFRDMALALTDRTEEKSPSKSILAPILSRLNLKKSGKK